jgi:hypothetical protein
MTRGGVEFIAGEGGVAMRRRLATVDIIQRTGAQGSDIFISAGTFRTDSTGQGDFFLHTPTWPPTRPTGRYT